MNALRTFALCLIVLVVQNAGADLPKWMVTLGNQAEAGYAEAQYLLGEVLYIGEGNMPPWFRKRTVFDPEDEAEEAEAAEWFRLAAEQGHSGAQYMLGRMYYHGHGVPKDDAEATKWILHAAEQEHPEAQHFLGGMYRWGEGGLSEDYAEAGKWYQRAIKGYNLAAEQGDAAGWYGLGRMYLYGDGVPRHTGKAVKWLTLAAEQGIADAQFELGWLYQKGEGGLPYYPTPDYAEAGKWYTCASNQGHYEAFLQFQGPFANAIIDAMAGDIECP